jgi:hypothetical protein
MKDSKLKKALNAVTEAIKDDIILSDEKVN